MSDETHKAADKVFSVVVEENVDGIKHKVISYNLGTIVFAHFIAIRGDHVLLNEFVQVK